MVTSPFFDNGIAIMVIITTKRIIFDPNLSSIYSKSHLEATAQVWVSRSTKNRFLNSRIQAVMVAVVCYLTHYSSSKLIFYALEKDALVRFIPCKVVKKLSGLKVICYTDILLVN